MVNPYNRQMVESHLRHNNKVHVKGPSFLDKHGWWFWYVLFAIIIISIWGIQMEDEEKFKEILKKVPTSELKEARCFIYEELRNRGEF